MIGKQIKKSRTNQNISQLQLAKRVGITQQSLSDIENGIIEQPRNLDKFAKALGVTQAYLLGEDDSLLLTNKGYISYNNSIPILKESEIMEWFKDNQLPINYESIQMNVIPSQLLNQKAALIDISSDSFCDRLFNIKLPNRRLFAIVNSTVNPTIYDIVIAKLPDEKIKIRQYIKDGEEFYLTSFDPIPEKDLVTKSEILGIISGYSHQPLENS